MSQYRCDGAGVEVGKTVVVRERTKLLDAQIYSGLVLKITPERGDGTVSPKDTVYIFGDDGVISTHRHCVYATKENILKLLQEVNDEIVKREDKLDYLETAIENRWHQMQREVGCCPNCFAERKCSDYELSVYAKRTEGYQKACDASDQAKIEKATLEDYKQIIEDVYDEHYLKEDVPVYKWHFDVTVDCTADCIDIIKDELTSICGVSQVTFYKV